jgi:hypothetical protein
MVLENIWEVISLLVSVAREKQDRDEGGERRHMG